MEKPSEICKTVLGAQRLADLLAELSAPQIKAVLKEGAIKVKLPGGFVSQQKRRKLWSNRILSAIEESDNAVAGELLQQWLLHHRREMLIAYLDLLGVKHRMGETDDSFLLSGSREKVQQAANDLLKRFDPTEVQAYLQYIAYQQKSPLFDDWTPTATNAEDAPPEATAENGGDLEESPPA